MTDSGQTTPASRAAGLGNALKQLREPPNRRNITNAEAQRLLERGLAELSCGGLTLTPCGRRALAEINGQKFSSVEQKTGNTNPERSNPVGPMNALGSLEKNLVLTSDAIIAASSATTKKKLFQEVASTARNAYGLDPCSVNDALWRREKAASTAVCGGVAIPHARLSGIDDPVGIFARLKHPIDFGAADGRGVDLVFVVLSPEAANTAHLIALARVARLLGSKPMGERIRSTSGQRSLFALITEPTAS